MHFAPWNQKPSAQQKTKPVKICYSKIVNSFLYVWNFYWRYLKMCRKNRLFSTINSVHLFSNSRISITFWDFPIDLDKACVFLFLSSIRPFQIQNNSRQIGNSFDENEKDMEINAIDIFR